jgi:hypothetical protein
MEKHNKISPLYNEALHDYGLKENSTPKYKFQYSGITNVLKKIPGTLWKHKGKVIGTSIYEGVLGKFIYDLNNVLSNPIVQSQVWRGKLPNGPNFYANLAPWPSITETIIKNPGQDVIIPKAMEWGDYALKAFHDNLPLKVVAIAAPFIIAGAYYGIKRYKRKK